MLEITRYFANVNKPIAVDAAMVDGNLVTAPAGPAHPQWLAQFLAVLGTRIEHQELAAV